MGTSAEREVARTVGGQRIGQYGGPADVIIPGYAVFQVKRTKGQPSLARCVELIERMPPGLLRGVVAISRPGRGHRARRVVVFDLEEWASYHAGGAVEDE